ncbi:SDR family NAD(P)-dependent oxidoreductase [Acrocarpospora catenulata]|uniref:SDR family NAD(P)-dependent oxidoreductase n=1 Tax=Acrocarpospora catenulata TaxID=2836182 RepID=UPI001BDAC44F|nr:SDR family oxidoreductase [Acrocarpospora catenulata]
MTTAAAYARLDLTGRSIIVTGAGSGLGRATAQLIAARGALVTVADVNAEAGGATVAEIEAAGGTAQFVATDITDESAVRDLVAAAVSAYGGLHGAHNNAGINGPAALAGDLGYDQWRQVLDINLNGVFLCLKYELAHMKENGGGSIVNTASTAAAIAYPNIPAYVASKHGVLGVTRQAALDYIRYGVRVNAVLPGSVWTPLAESALKDPEIRAKAESAQPIGRLGEPHEIAEMVAWLLSDAASFAVGSPFFVDGGVNAG